MGIETATQLAIRQKSDFPHRMITGWKKSPAIISLKKSDQAIYVKTCWTTHRCCKRKKRDQNCGINHLPNSAGNVTPDCLEVLGCFQTGETSSLYLRFQARWDLTALHRRSKAFSHPSSPNCCGWVCGLLFYFVHFCSVQDVGKSACALKGRSEKMRFYLVCRDQASGSAHMTWWQEGFCSSWWGRTAGAPWADRTFCQQHLDRTLS